MYLHISSSIDLSSFLFLIILIQVCVCVCDEKYECLASDLYSSMLLLYIDDKDIVVCFLFVDCCIL